MDEENKNNESSGMRVPSFTDVWLTLDDVIETLKQTKHDVQFLHASTARQIAFGHHVKEDR